MKPRPYADPVTGKDEPPIKDWRNQVATMGEDWRSLPSAWWGWRDWEQHEMTNRPIGQSLPPPPPARSLPAGFSLFPGQQRPPETAGDRALREIKKAKADAALSKLTSV